jgi:aspartate racemase
MKTIGLIGGLSWVSTLDYYRIINEEVNKLRGGDEAARLILYSLNYGKIKKLSIAGDWNAIIIMITNAAQKLEKAGADCLLICANTMHKVANEVKAAISIPLIHIADVTADEIKMSNLDVVALLGTKYTMQMDFYKEKLSGYGIKTIIPNERDVAVVNDAIYQELGRGIFLEKTKNEFIRIINDLGESGAKGVILGCTEIPILIKQSDCKLPLFDTTFLHAKAAVNFALAS